ncbi:hypothetical protein DH2020_008167 [Rehmannia glutinosa]|uniref:Reverse transcriptase Ty1/copia-type domain-containing protein n=1 Tax=Rehmannia glutinosa TaxID=99300 RepID=A0ABR0U071_REHGL
MQPDGFIQKGQEHRVCKLKKSIYGLKQASRSWNIRFDQAVKSYGFDQNPDGPCVYKKIKDNKVTFLVLYVDDIMLIGNDIGMLTSAKYWLAQQFDMKDLGEASYVLGIRIFRDRKNKQIALSQASYIDKILTPSEVEYMKKVPYASAVGSLMYAMLCMRPDICYAVGIVSRYQSNPGPEHWIVVKHILKYLRRTRGYMLVYSATDLVPMGYTDSDFQADRDTRKSTSGSVFTLGGGAVIWRSIKQSCIADSTMEAEYVAACEAAKEAVWLRNFLLSIERGKHIERKYHLVRDIVQRGDVLVSKIASAENLAEPFTKSLPTRSFEGHIESMGVLDMSHLL